MTPMTVDLKGFNTNIARMLAGSKVVAVKELPAFVACARAIEKLLVEHQGEVFPEPIEETAGLWLAIAALADEAGRAKPERRTCNNCRFVWDAPRSRPAETQKEVDERLLHGGPADDVEG